MIYDRFVFDVLWAVSKRWAWWAPWSECSCENDASRTVPEVTTGRPYEGTSRFNLCVSTLLNKLPEEEDWQPTGLNRLQKDWMTTKSVITLYSAFIQYSDPFIRHILCCSPMLTFIFSTQVYSPYTIMTKQKQICENCQFIKRKKPTNISITKVFRSLTQYLVEAPLTAIHSSSLFGSSVAGLTDMGIFNLFNPSGWLRTIGGQRFLR